MSEVAPLTPEEQIATLQAQVASLRAEAFAAQISKPKRLAGISRLAKKIGKGLWAAVASTDAVKQEKSLAALIIFRVLINIGASASLVGLVKTLLSLAGVK